MSQLLNPQRWIPPVITDLTRISSKDVAGKPVIEDVIKDISCFIGDGFVVDHNVAFDFRFLNKDLAENGYPTIGEEKIVDTMKISRAIPASAPLPISFRIMKHYAASDI